MKDSWYDPYDPTGHFPKRVSTVGKVSRLAVSTTCVIPIFELCCSRDSNKFLSFPLVSLSPLLASVSRQVTPVFLFLSALFTGLEITTSITGWAWIPSSLDRCQLCKAEVHAVLGFSSSSSLRSGTSLQLNNEYLHTFIMKARTWLQNPDFPAAQLGPQYACSTSPETIQSASFKLCGSSRVLKL